jgi:hypothetical protein
MSRADTLRMQLAHLLQDKADGKHFSFTKYRRIEQQLHDEVYKA